MTACLQVLVGALMTSTFEAGAFAGVGLVAIAVVPQKQAIVTKQMTNVALFNFTIVPMGCGYKGF